MLERVRGLVGVVWREAAKFGIVGAICLVVDMVGFNLLVDGPLEGKITTAKIVSGAIATVLAWIGNRYWTFRHRQNRPMAHEVTMFFAVNGVALAIGSAWLAFTHYALGMDSALATNINAFIGIGLGTLFRFWAYRQVVFRAEYPGGLPDEQDGTSPHGDDTGEALIPTSGPAPTPVPRTGTGRTAPDGR